MIECVLLGSGGMMPMPYRFLVSLAVRIEGMTLMFDCGEATQIPLKSMKIGVKPIRHIFITHLHADHVTGLPGMLMMLAQADPEDVVTIYGPRGIAAYVHAQERTLGFERRFPLEIVELHGADGVALSDANFEVVFRRLRHGPRCLGYAVIERPRAGRFDVEAAVSLGVKPGPDFGRLQGGESLTLTDGRVVTPDDVLGPPRPGRKIAYITDTRPCANVVELARGADVVYIEGMFLSDMAEEAARKGHQTARQAAEQVAAAGASRAFLIHFSPRYAPDELSLLEREAREVYPAIDAGRDMTSFSIPVKP
ncbi:ribonuclease Z [bacterium]|nr:ribonuclease Z [bacterium]